MLKGNGVAARCWRLGRAVTATMVAAFAVALSGCVPEPQIFARVDQEVLILRVCGPGVVESIDVDVLPAGVPVANGWERAWTLTGDRAIQDSLDIVYGVEPQGLQTEGMMSGLSLLEQDVRVTARFSRDAEPGPLQSAAVFQGLSTADESWQSESGDRLENPCS